MSGNHSVGQRIHHHGTGPRWSVGGHAIVYGTATESLEQATVAMSPALVVQSRTPFVSRGKVALDFMRGVDVSRGGKSVVVVQPSERMKVLVVLN